jgi:hypothetical protein
MACSSTTESLPQVQIRLKSNRYTRWFMLSYTTIIRRVHTYLLKEAQMAGHKVHWGVEGGGIDSVGLLQH